MDQGVESPRSFVSTLARIISTLQPGELPLRTLRVKQRLGVVAKMKAKQRDCHTQTAFIVQNLKQMARPATEIKPISAYSCGNQVTERIDL